jgi:hypothetical protein
MDVENLLLGGLAVRQEEIYTFTPEAADAQGSRRPPGQSEHLRAF